MARKEDESRVRLEVDGKQAINELGKLEMEAKELKVDMKNAKKGTEEYIQANKKLKEVTKKIKGVRDELGLQGMTFQQLIRYQRDLRNEMRFSTTKGTADYEKLRKKLKEVNAAVVRQRKDLNGTGQAFGGLTRQIMSMGGALGLAFGATQVIQNVRKWIGLSSEFEQSMSNLSAITGAVGEELRFFEREAKRVGSTTTFTASESAKAFELIASKKPELLENREALVATSEAAITLAEAAGIELPAAAEALTNTLNQFNEGAEASERFINALAAGSKFGAGNIDFLNDAIKRFGPVADQMNVSFERSVAMMEVFAEKGLESEKAGTQFRNILIELAKGADETNPAIVGMETALKNLADQQLSTAELAQKFGAQNLVGAQIMVNSTARFEEFTRKVTDTNVAYEQAEIRMNNFNGLMKELGSIAEFYGIVLGGLVTNALTPFVRTIIDAAVGLKDLFNATEASKRAFQEQTREMESQNKRLDPLLDRYEELRQKSNRSSEEQKELESVIADLARIVPTAATEFDEYGNAVGISTGKINQFREAQIAANKILNRKAIDDQTKELGKLEKEIEKVNNQLNRRNEDGDIVKLVTQSYGFQQTIKEVSLTGEEITSLQGRLKELQDQAREGRMGLAFLSGEDTPEMAEAREKEKADAENRAREKANQEAEEQRQQEAEKRAQREAQEQERREKEHVAHLQRLQKDYERYQEDIKKAARDFEISQMEAQEGEVAKVKDRYEKLMEELRVFHDENIIKEEEFTEKLKELHERRQEEIFDINQRYREKEEEERQKAEEKIKEALDKAADEDEDGRTDRLIKRVNDQYDELIKLAQNFGIDTTALEQAREDEITRIQKAAQDQRIRDEEEAFNAKKEIYMSFGQAAVGVLDMVNSFSSESGEFGKVLAIGTAAVRSGEAIANMVAAFTATSLDPISLAARIAAGIGVIGTNIGTAVRSIRRANFPAAPEAPEMESARGSRGSTGPSVVSSFYHGGETGTMGMGFGDKYGEFAGVVHKNEYVVPAFIRSHPYVADVMPAIEAIRRDAVRGFYTGGETSAPEGPGSGPDVHMDLSGLEQRLDQVILRLDKMPTRLKAYLVDSEWQEFREVRDGLEERYKR